MLLVLNVQFYRNEPVAPQAGRFSESGGSIGRSPGNVLVLDDPAKYISRTHALVTFRSGQFYLADMGSNPSVVNDRPLGNGREVVLASGDRIAIGDYQLQVQIEAAAGSLAEGSGTGPGADLLGLLSPVVPAPSLPLFEPPPLSPPVVLPPLENFGRPAVALPDPAPAAMHDALAGASILASVQPSSFSSAADPLGLNLFGSPTGTRDVVPGAAVGDPLGVGFRGSVNDHAAPERFAMPLPVTPAAAPASSPESYAAAAWPAPSLPSPSPVVPAAQPSVAPAAGWGGAIPDDYDPLAGFMPTPASSGVAPAAAPPFAGAVTPLAAQALQLPDDFDPLAAPASDATALPVHALRAAPAAPAAAAKSAAGPASAQMPPHQAVDMPDERDAVVPGVAPAVTSAGQLATPGVGTPAAAAAQRTAPIPASHQDLPGADLTLEALLRGLGLPDLQTRLGAQELAELVGAMLREATAGAMQTLMARSVTKRESRVEMTMIASQANNPLKFFPDAGSALSQMLSQKATGYMKPVRAFGNAFEDLQAHELAVMAGMRAALAAVLQRFDPQAIEQRLDVPTVMDKMMASSRKAKMWDRLVSLYADITREADDDFQRLFGESFAKAYEEQVDRMHRSK